VEPGPELRDLEHRILRHDEALAVNALHNAGAPVPRADDLRTNLPHPVDSFVGRDNEIAELSSLLGDYRLVTLTGPGGIGKTRLAVEVGRMLVDDYADGVWLAELAPVIDDDLVATVVAETWGLTAAESDVDDLVISFLRPRQLVLVLDNCEHVSGAASRFVARILREAPGVRILATSRESLGIAGEAAMRVPSLDQRRSGDAPGAAAALFVDRGRAARPGWTPSAGDAAAIDRICERLEGIPLGLELAVAYGGVDPVTDRERRRWHSVGTSRAGADAIASSITETNRVPIPRGRNALTLGEYLTNTWLPERQRRVRATIAYRYEWMIERYIARPSASIR